MKRFALLLGVAGAALFIVLIARQGFQNVWETAISAGWFLPLIVLAHGIPVTADTLSWRSLFPPDRRPSFLQLVWLRWIREGVNHLLPTARVGGDFVRARLTSWRYVPMPTAAATVVADLTSGIFTQAGFTLIGLALLIAVNGTSSGILLPTFAGVGLALGLFTAFFLVQRHGLFALIGKLLSKLSRSKSWALLSEDGQRLDDSVREVYSRRADLIKSMSWTMVSWITGATEVWLAMLALGHPVTIAEAIIIESVGQAVRGASFMVPGALGVQEGGLTLICGIFGIPGDQALALSLIKRFRELTLGAPALIVWQSLEGKRLLDNKRNPNDQALKPQHETTTP